MWKKAPFAATTVLAVAWIGLTVTTRLGRGGGVCDAFLPLRRRITHPILSYYDNNKKNEKNKNTPPLTSSIRRDEEGSASATTDDDDDDDTATTMTTTKTPTTTTPTTTTKTMEPSPSSGDNDTDDPHHHAVGRVTLTRFLNQMVKEEPELMPLQSLLLSVQMACKTISHLVGRAGLSKYGTDRLGTGEPFETDGRFYSMKRLDQLSTNVLKNALRFTGKVNLVAPAAYIWEEKPAEHQPGVLIAQSLDSAYVACLDPLDGSGNADASICTGTVFGVFEDKDKNTRGTGKKQKQLLQDNDDDDDDDKKDEMNAVKSEQDHLVNSILQPGKHMRAAGYCMYSSATVLVFTLGDGIVNGFTLDSQLHEFVLTHPNLTIPQRGNVYSCNEANSEGWSKEFTAYLKALKTGCNESKRRYAHRYVGSMVGDIHRTILYGGIFCYPSDTMQHPRGNLQLLYKSAPMAFIVNQAGGKSIDENAGDLLDVRPDRVHQKSPCFMGSPADIDELKDHLERGIH